MKFRPVILGSLFAAATLGVEMLAMADDHSSSDSKPLKFATPKIDGTRADMGSSMDQLDDPFKAPGNLLSQRSSSGSAPMPMPPSQNYRPVQDKKNWMLMTPEEILGVKTSAQVLGVKSGDDLNSDDATPEEKFMQRKQQADSATKPRSENPFDSSHWDSLNQKRSDVVGNDEPAGTYNSFGTLSRMLSDQPSASPFSDFRQSGNGGDGKFQQDPTTSATAVAKQKADMDAFRAMLGEHVDSPNSDARPASLTTAIYHSRDTAAASPLQSNPYGGTFKPLADAGVKPVGLDPLTEWGHTQKKKVETPSWAPKPPPWLSQEPLANGMPQRKF